MPLLSPEGSRKLDNALGSALPASPTPPNPQARHPEERANMPSGANPKPTKAPLASRSASPPDGYGSGIERAMGGLADKEHPRKGR